jgi:hypothetical protein
MRLVLEEASLRGRRKSVYSQAALEQQHDLRALVVDPQTCSVCQKPRRATKKSVFFLAGTGATARFTSGASEISGFGDHSFGSSLRGFGDGFSGFVASSSGADSFEECGSGKPSKGAFASSGSCSLEGHEPNKRAEEDVGSAGPELNQEMVSPAILTRQRNKQTRSARTAESTEVLAIKVSLPRKTMELVL